MKAMNCKFPNQKLSLEKLTVKKMEPVERLLIDVPEDSMGSVMESLGARKAEMVNMINNGTGQVRLEFLIPARGLIGYRTQLPDIDSRLRYNEPCI